MVSLPCPALFPTKDLVLEYPSKTPFKRQKNVQGSDGSQKLKAESLAKMDVEKVLYKQTNKQIKPKQNKTTTKVKQPNKPPGTPNLSFFHTQCSWPSGALCLLLERKATWMVVHNQNRSTVLVPMFPLGNARKAKR